jgi:regulator of replication initiation timing
MFDKIVDFGKQLLSLKGQIEKNVSDIKELRDDLKTLSTAFMELRISNNELKTRFDHLKEMEKSERDKLVREWQVYQNNYQKDQEIVFLKLKNLIQDDKISKLSQNNEEPKLLGDGDSEI